MSEYAEQELRKALAESQKLIDELATFINTAVPDASFWTEELGPKADKLYTRIMELLK